MHTHSCTISLCYMHTASFSWGPPHGSSSSFWERPDCRASVLFPSISQSKLNQQKAAASVTASAYQIKTQALSNASVSCVSGQERSQGPRSMGPWRFDCDTKIKEKKTCHLWHCLSVECFDSLKYSVKAAWMKNVDICCWKLFTFYCCSVVIVALATYFLRSVTV